MYRHTLLYLYLTYGNDGMSYSIHNLAKEEMFQYLEQLWSVRPGSSNLGMFRLLRKI